VWDRIERTLARLGVPESWIDIVILLVFGLAVALAALVAFVYKENLLGFKTWVKAKFRAGGGAPVDPIPSTQTPSAVDMETDENEPADLVASTVAVAFDSERTPSRVALLRALSELRRLGGAVKVPLEYDHRIDGLCKRATRTRDRLALSDRPEDYLRAQRATEQSSKTLGELPRKLGDYMRLLDRSNSLPGDEWIARSGSCFVELILTQLIARLASAYSG
jgi:hypothetical protein